LNCQSAKQPFWGISANLPNYQKAINLNQPNTALQLFLAQLSIAPNLLAAAATT
jgi:hypothetical protein